MFNSCDVDDMFDDDSWDVDEETRLQIMEDEYQAEQDRLAVMQDAWEQQKAA